jgi:hypothetical protein
VDDSHVTGGPAPLARQRLIVERSTRSSPATSLLVINSGHLSAVSNTAGLIMTSGLTIIAG